ncbi:HNH endonuclease [Blastococcus xanthinilyticus]|uniref:HNH endonuclease n=1 Tax=Blastococcus xanthinilyticus TaxID=1564164 RepID=A0A5S5CPG9_9ACTN|nr:HNH endonuclease [Blastococcus xanthinilyticus]TYP84942.1 HNH endonuclease [Blastococcus xanthinilyticus]
MARVSAQPDRAARLQMVLDRDGPTCVWCGRAFSPLVRPTTEHVVPRVKGGPSWLQNEVAACGRCNGERGHRAPVEWLEECRRRGWPADVHRLARALIALDEAIVRLGGQRRARPYLDAQLRRLRRLDAAA